MGFKEEKQEVEKIMLEQFSSPLLSELRSNGRITTRGDVTVSLAEQYGFCWGVERAVRFYKLIIAMHKFVFLNIHILEQIAMAYEARSHFPEQNIYLTNEIIHNPEVHQEVEAKISF